MRVALAPIAREIRENLDMYVLALDEQKLEFTEFLTASQAFDFHRAEDARARFLAFAEAGFDRYTEACRKLQEMGRG